ncbi:MAG: amidohydrolase [Planctomycetaceae bacterium]|nr:amidohydrolase [Planctomycetaceae bacterium]
MTDTRRFTSRLLVPLDGPPIPGGVLEVCGGRISAVFAGPDPSATDLGDLALIPGLINAHTHLEFSGLAKPLPAPDGLVPWLRNVVATRGQRPASANPVRAGLDELQACGTAAAGDITTEGPASTQSSPGDPSRVVFREIIGLRSTLRSARLALARDFLAEERADDCLRGISPHAPYSVHPDLFGDLVGLANTHDAPLAIHLAESPEELLLLANGSGPLRLLLEELDAWEDNAIASGSRPLDYLRPLALLSRPLVIHGNLLDDTELAWLADHRHVAVVYCPRSHAHFGHPPHPWLQLLETGTPVILGTDSRASNPDLSVWNELQFLSRTTSALSPTDLLSMATQAAARALGLGSNLGSLTPGKKAFAVAVALPASTPWTLQSILQSGRIAGSLQNGHWHPA